MLRYLTAVQVQNYTVASRLFCGVAPLHVCISPSRPITSARVWVSLRAEADAPTCSVKCSSDAKGLGHINFEAGSEDLRELFGG